LFSAAGQRLLKGFVAFDGTDGADVLDGLTVDLRADQEVEIGFVLNDAGDDELHAGASGGVDGQVDAFVGVDASEEEEFVTRLSTECNIGQVDAVVDGGEIGQFGVAVGVADGDEPGVVFILAVNHADAVGGEAVNGGQHGGFDQTRIGQGQEVVIVVDQVELACMFHQFGDVEALDNLGFLRGVFLIAAVDDGAEFGAGEGIGGGEKGDVPAAAGKAFADVGGDGFPGAVLARGRPPGDGGEDGDFFCRAEFVDGHWFFKPQVTRICADFNC
jgi:hypothetical protein